MALLSSTELTVTPVCMQVGCSSFVERTLVEWWGSINLLREAIARGVAGHSKLHRETDHAADEVLSAGRTVHLVRASVMCRRGWRISGSPGLAGPW